MSTSKVWLVTGASRGWGLSLVKQLLAAGHRVAATSRNVKRLKDAVGVIDRTHFLPLAVDLNNTDCIDECIRQTLAVFGRIDGVVNNAGGYTGGPMEDMENRIIRDLIDINLIAAMEVAKQVLPVLKAQGSGHIVNVGVPEGLDGTPGAAVYLATKAALKAFSEALSREVAAYGIQVTMVGPGKLRRLCDRVT